MSNKKKCLECGKNVAFRGYSNIIYPHKNAGGEKCFGRLGAESVLSARQLPRVVSFTVKDNDDALREKLLDAIERHEPVKSTQLFNRNRTSTEEIIATRRAKWALNALKDEGEVRYIPRVGWVRNYKEIK